MRPIVLMTLRGGLGNQMFQYALGQAIARKHGRMLVLDDLALRVDHPGRTRRAYALGAFDIEARLTSAAPIDGAAIRAVVAQERRGFRAEVLEPCPFALLQLQGFWQDERYFADIAHVLRGHFRMMPGPWESSRWRARIAAAPAAVCVHVRRQDYLTPAGAALGFVGRGYYARAVAAAAERIASPHFFVFSDDPAWCRENLRLAHPHAFVEHDGAAEDHVHTDFLLMTQCRHFVIANSSFSWWPAWLGTDPRKVVVAPKAWFRDSDADSEAVVPRDWLRV